MKKTLIKIHDISGVTRDVLGFRYGHVCVHRPLTTPVSKVYRMLYKPNARWCITHIESGISLAEAQNIIDASRFAKEFDALGDLSVIASAMTISRRAAIALKR